MKIQIVRCITGVMVYACAMSALLLAAHLASASDARGQQEKTAVIYEGGEVWNGEGFERRNIALRDGVFIDLNGAGSDAHRIDVSGKFITPPYANAHHHITNPNDQTGWAFLEHGVYYVWNPNLISTAWSEDAAAYYARTDTYDVRVSMGGVTEPGGHPEKLYVKTLSQYVYPDLEYDDFYGTAFHYGRTHAEIDEALDLLVRQRAHFVKALLLWSEEYELRRDDEAYYGLKGLNPANMPYLVKAAHVRNLPVAVHVQSRHDALVSVDAGADMLAHLPAHSAYQAEHSLHLVSLSREDAKRIADAGVTSVPTYALTVYNYQSQLEEGVLDTDLRDRHYAIQAENLRFLADAGGVILTGTDAAPHIFDEVEHWIDIGGLTALRSLQSVYQTGRYLFPDRKLGRIAPGYEADFLVMGADPTEDIGNLSAIEMRVKGGKIIAEPSN